MTKVLIVANHFDRTDGWGTVAHYLASTLEKEGFAVVTRLEADKASRARFSFWLGVLDAIRFRAAFRGQDHVICVCEPLLPMCVFHRLLSARSRLILLGYGTYAYYPFMRGWRKYWLRWFARRVDAFFVVSRYTERRVREWWGNAPLGLLRLGVEPKKYRKGDSSAEKVFLFVGALKERKGVSPLLKAFALLLKDHPDAVLEFAGKAPIEYQRLATSLGVDSRVRFLGKVSDDELARRFSQARCHVLPSVNTDRAFEGFGLVHLEANAFGIPSIGSSETANDEVIEDGKTGFLCRQGDVEHIRSRMNQILEDEPSYRAMCEAALQHAQEHDWQKVLSEFWNAVRDHRSY